MVGTRFVRRVVGFAVVALIVPVVSSSHASAVGVLADWEMNDVPGTTVMLDSSGNGINGALASNAADDGLTTGVNFNGDTLFRFGHIVPGQDYLPGHIVRIDDARLNPGSHSWAISFRYRTHRKFGNIMQKGQATTKGGQIKFQLPKGQISCMFKGGNGQTRSIKTIKSYADDAWHVVNCVRTPTSVTLTVDAGTPNAETRKINGPSGSISNTFPMTIGGKPSCDQVEVSCDYFEGDIDWVKVEDLG